MIEFNGDLRCCSGCAADIAAASSPHHDFAVVFARVEKDGPATGPSAVPLRRFGAKPDKKIVDRQAASPSSWKTPCIATRMAWQWASIGFGLCAPRGGRSG